MKHRLFIGVTLLSLLIILIPYLAANSAGGGSALFNGFLLNPLDGNSYLAKMRIGWEGGWIFRLPYTADPGQGAYLFLFYIFLGHLARLLNLSLALTFHLARLLVAVFLIYSIYRFCQLAFEGSPAWARRSFVWIALGSGLGWLVFSFGQAASDLLVPEAYPFLSEYVNPHFPLGLALLLWVFIWSLQSRLRAKVLILVTGLLLAIIQPFAVVVGGLVLAGTAAWKAIETRRLDWQPVFWFALGGGPFLAYQFWISTTDPVLSGWNVQNLTPSPALWDLILSFSPALALALLALFRLRKLHLNDTQKLTVVWFAASLVLSVVPFSLQRRFLTGLYVPTIVLACLGIALWVQALKRQRRLFTLAFTLSLPTLAVILVVASFGITTQDPSLYRSTGEQQAFDWLESSAPSGSLVLSGPDTGSLIPVYTNDRVLYGHPFETVEAARMKSLVSSFYTGDLAAAAALGDLNQWKVDYVFYGPREKKLGAPAFLNQLRPVYQNSDVVIYAVD